MLEPRAAGVIGEPRATDRILPPLVAICILKRTHLPLVRAGGLQNTPWFKVALQLSAFRPITAKNELTVGIGYSTKGSNSRFQLEYYLTEVLFVRYSLSALLHSTAFRHEH